MMTAMIMRTPRVTPTAIPITFPESPPDTRVSSAVRHYLTPIQQNGRIYGVCAAINASDSISRKHRHHVHQEAITIRAFNELHV